VANEARQRLPVVASLIVYLGLALALTILWWADFSGLWLEFARLIGSEETVGFYVYIHYPIIPVFALTYAALLVPLVLVVAAGRKTLNSRLPRLAILGLLVTPVLFALTLGGYLETEISGAAAGARLLETPPIEGRDDLEVGAREGQLAPDFEISAFDGTRHRLSDFRGKVVFVNFWATWCVPCQFELPDIAELQDRHPDDVVVLLVNRRESVSKASDYLDNLPRLDGGSGVEFPVEGVDPDDTLYDHYRALAMPSSFFVGPDGVITAVAYGPVSLEQMETVIGDALAGT
jgi:thiol-disulfide isomerase/thioredoxin